MSSKEPSKIFQDKALEQLSSPEQLDQLMEVVNRKSWLPIWTIAGLMGVALVWSFLGQIPITVEGTGLLVYPRQIVSFQMPASGQIVSLNAKVGDFVERGQVLATINQPALEQSLEQERLRLAELERRNLQVLPLRDQRTELERQSVERERGLFEERIVLTLATAEEQRQKNAAYFEEQRRSLQSLIAVKQTMDETLQMRYEGYLTLREDGLVSDEAVLNARQNHIDNQVQIADLQLQLNQIELSELQADEKYQEKMELVRDLEFQLRELEIRAAEIDQEQLESDSDTELELQDVRGMIARYEEELRRSGQIVSEYSGRVLEVTAAVGQIVSAGQRLGSMEAEDPEGKLVAVAYFEIGDGKRVVPGMGVRVSPTTVERERYGNMIGVVTSVSPFPVTTEAVTNVVGNAEIAETLVAGGIKIEVFCELEVDPTSPTGYGWTSGLGPETEVTAGTTASVRATIEFRRPITLVVPIMRRLSGT